MLVEALFAERRFGPDGKVAFHVPVEHQKRYPSLGRVHSHYKDALHELVPGEFVVLEDEGIHIDRTYYDVFQIVLDDLGKQLILTVDNDIEPLFRETIERYRSSPTSENRHISVKDVGTDEWWSFLCSDVLSYGYETLAHPTYDLESVPTFMIELMHGKKMKLFYIVHISKIMTKLRRVKSANDSTE